MEKEDPPCGDSADVHNRLWKIQVLIASGIIGYIEIRLQLLTDVVRDLTDRFNEHSMLTAHEGQAGATSFLTELVFYILDEIGLQIPR